MFETISPVFRERLIEMADHYAKNGIPPKKGVAGVTPIGRREASPSVQQVPEGEGWAAEFVKQTILTKLASSSPQEFGPKTSQLLQELREAIDLIEAGMRQPEKKQASVKIVAKGF